MKYTQMIIVSAVVVVSVISCKRKGCTDCNATNYNVKADKDDNSCQFVNEDLLGVYAVQDSMIGPPILIWYHDSYDIEVSRSTCAPNNLTFSNYANKNSGGAVFSVDCQIENNSITITEQYVNGDNVRTSSGYFSNDSIYFDFEYENEFGEVFHGKCFGSKK